MQGVVAVHWNPSSNFNQSVMLDFSAIPVPVNKVFTSAAGQSLLLLAGVEVRLEASGKFYKCDVQMFPLISFIAKNIRSPAIETSFRDEVKL